LNCRDYGFIAAAPGDALQSLLQPFAAERIEALMLGSEIRNAIGTLAAGLAGGTVAWH
jgi:hypothetical protein